MYVYFGYAIYILYFINYEISTRIYKHLGVNSYYVL